MHIDAEGVLDGVDKLVERLINKEKEIQKQTEVSSMSISQLN